MHSHQSLLYREAEFEEIPCDLCGDTSPAVLGFSKDDGARAVICPRCGLIFVSPRMTRTWYDRFYQEEYRSLGGHNDIHERFESQYKHGRAFAKELEPYFLKSGLLVDVGSSTGGTLAGLKEVLPGVDALGIEPSELEADFAKSRGITTYAVLIEDIEKKGIAVPLADQILCTQSLNHFLSPRFFFTWAWHHLKPGGRLILEVKNFRQQARRSGRVGNSIQMDHVYMFTPETVREYLETAGFRIVATAHDEGFPLAVIRERQKKGLPAWQIRVVAEKTDEVPFSDVSRHLDRAAFHLVRTSLLPWHLFLHHIFRYSRWDELMPFKRNR